VPTFFEVSRIATKQLLALAHVMKFLPLADTLELANRGVIYEAILCRPILFKTVNSDWPIKCIIAPQEAALWAHVIWS